MAPTGLVGTFVFLRTGALLPLPEVRRTGATMTPPSACARSPRAKKYVGSPFARDFRHSSFPLTAKSWQPPHTFREEIGLFNFGMWQPPRNCVFSKDR